MLLVPRNEWGAVAPSAPVARIPGPVTSVTFHYEGPQMGFYDHSHCSSVVKGIQEYHMKAKGWVDIAYNALVCYHGFTFEGRWLGARSAANGTNPGNSTSYAICGMWGVGDPLTPQAQHAYLETRGYFMAHGAGSIIYPHKYWFNSACPGIPVDVWIKAGCPDPLQGAPIVPSDPTPTDKAVAIDYPPSGGVVTFAADGGVFTEEGAGYFGGLGGTHLNAPIVWGACTDSGQGYWMVGADGGIFAFGDAHPISPYLPLFTEYAVGARRITTARRRGAGLVLMSNLGERYPLGV